MSYVKTTYYRFTVSITWSMSAFLKGNRATLCVSLPKIFPLQTVGDFVLSGH